MYIIITRSLKAVKFDKKGQTQRLKVKG